MARPLSSDLRVRIVRTVEAGTSCNAAAVQFAVSISFVVKLMQRWRERGTVEPDQYGGWRKAELLPHEGLIREIVSGRNDITLEELRIRLLEAGISTSVPTLCRFLKMINLTRKKRRSTPASKRDRTLPRPARRGASGSPS